MIAKGFVNPVKSLQFTFGEADLTVDDNGDIRLIDRFNWNDADPTKRYRDPADWSEEGFLLMKDVKSFNDWDKNNFIQDAVTKAFSGNY